METDIGVKPVLAHIGNAGVVGTSSRLDAEFTAVRQDKGSRLMGPSKLSVGEAMSPPSHLASSSWAMGHGERRVSPSSPLGHGRYRVAPSSPCYGQYRGVHPLHGSGSRAPS